MTLFQLSSPNHASKASVPSGMRVYAIGDIHGRVDLLRRLHDMIRIDLSEARNGDLPSDHIIVYLGDYVDRGIHCPELIDLLLDDPLDGVSTFFLRGNHEQKVIDFLVDTEIGPDWVFWGGDSTLRAYGVDIEDPAFGQQGWSWVQERFREGLPARHLSFLKSTISCHVVGDYYFVHAGVKPGVPLNGQVPADQLWIRGEFLDSNEDFGKIIVHGHSIVGDVEVHANRIAVDTGAWRTGKLSSLVLEGNQMHVLQT